MRKKNPAAVMGRPTKITPQVAEHIFMLAGYGLTERQIADVVNINPDTITEAKKKADFSVSIRSAKEKADMLVVKALFNRAVGSSVVETRPIVIKGKIIDHKITKNFPPDPESISLWLFNRKAHEWKPAKNQEIIAPPDETPRALHQIFVNVRKKEDMTIRSGKDQLEVLFGEQRVKKAKEKTDGKSDDKSKLKPRV